MDTACSGIYKEQLGNGYMNQRYHWFVVILWNLHRLEYTLRIISVSNYWLQNGVPPRDV